MWAGDLLHIVDLNGVTGHAIANLLTDAIRDYEWPDLRNQAAMFHHINESLRQFYNRAKETDRIGEFLVI